MINNGAFIIVKSLEKIKTQFMFKAVSTNAKKKQIKVSIEVCTDKSNISIILRYHI